MAVIVTGATSFIGRAVVEELLKQGQKVYAVARPGSAGLSFLKALPLNGQEGRREGAVGSIRILECNFHENNFSIQDDNNMRLYNLDLPVGKIVTSFVENGLEVSEVVTSEESLEEYFKRVTGGEGIA